MSNERSLDDLVLSEDLQELIDDGYLEEGTAAYGIARFVIDYGEWQTSARQRWVWDDVIADELEMLEQRLECGFCDDDC